MSEHQDPESAHPRAASSVPADRLVYVMPSESGYAAPDDEIDLRELWRIIWSGKWKIIASTTFFSLAAVIYALMATEWYRAEVLVAPADQKSAPSIGGQLGGLAALAGVSIGGGDTADAVATIKSRELARDFISDYQLLPLFFSELWDSAGNVWKVSDPLRQPDVRDGVRFFHQSVLQVSEDRKTGLITVAVQWKDPVLAAEWATELVERVNTKLRERTLQDAEKNVVYLQAELAKTNVVTLQQAIGRLLESELQKLMLARGNSEFAFRIIDRAYPPKFRDRPKRAMIAVVGTLAGGFFGLFWVFIGNALRSGESRVFKTRGTPM